MQYNYQVIVLYYDEFKSDLVKTFQARLSELGVRTDSVVFLNENNFNAEYDARNPSVCAYLSKQGTFSSIDIIKKLIIDAVFILPIVPSLSKYKLATPSDLHFINGAELADPSTINATANRLLEALSLLRESRRLFISYRRVESRSIAIQLYERLDQNIFDVFLDTHSLKAGDHFQEELFDLAKFIFTGQGAEDH